MFKVRVNAAMWNIDNHLEEKIMSYFKSIRFKLLLMTVGLQVLVALALIATAIVSSDKLVNDNSVNVSESIEQTIYCAVENWRVSTLSYAQIAVDQPSPELIAAINNAASKEIDPERNVRLLEDEDAARIIDLVRDAFAHTGCDGMTFADPQGYALARVTAPTNYGQNIKTSLAIADAMEGLSVSYAYPTLNNGFSITAGVPIYDGNELIGVLFLSKRLDKTTTIDEIKRMTGCEIVIYQGTDDGTIPVMSSYLEDASTLGDLDAGIEASIISGQSVSINKSFEGNSAVWRYTPIEGRNGAIVGAILTIHTLESSSWTLIMWVCIFFGVCIILTPVLMNAIRGIVFPLRTLTEHTKRLSLGDTTVDIAQTRKDEIGMLQSAMEALTVSMRTQSEALEQVASGNLSVTYEPRSAQDSVGNSLSKMITSNNEILSSIRASSVQVSMGAKQVADGSQSLAQGATEQAASIQQLSSSISEIADKTKSNATMAEKASKLADSIKDNAQKGSTQMGEMVSAVNEINDASSSINKVIKVIDDIAFQTNILALNAAVEAARAGQHGKGFAVVAEEVRNLAAKSAEAAKDTGGLIENSIEKANLGVNIADETAKSLAMIVSGINESSQLVTEIAKSSEEQSVGIEHINKGIEQVAQVVQQNSATAEESAAASQEMSSQSTLLQELISQFNLKDGGDSRVLPPGTAFEQKRLSRGSETTDGFGKY